MAARTGADINGAQDDHASQTIKSLGKNLPGQIVLVLEGGGALGSYQAGVYQALHEAGIEPDWLIGTSIGAINASLIAGNAPAFPAVHIDGELYWDGGILSNTPTEVVFDDKSAQGLADLLRASAESAWCGADHHADARRTVAGAATRSRDPYQGVLERRVGEFDPLSAVILHEQMELPQAAE